MKKMLFFIFAIALLNSSVYAHWADSQIDTLKKADVLEKVFELHNLTEELGRPITREEFFALTSIINNETSTELSANFADASEVSEKLSLYVGGLTGSGVIQGIPENDRLYIKPKQEIKRQEAAVILSKIFNLTDEAYEIKFNDANIIANWAMPYLAGVIKAGIINGYPDNTVKAENNITVAEAIVILANSYHRGFFDKAINFSGTGESMLINGEKLLATYTSPSGLSVKGDALYVADTGNNAIRCITNNEVNTLAGGNIGRDEYNEAIGSFRDGKDALFDSPTYLVALENGILLTDKNNNLIRFIDNEGRTTTFAGSLNSGLANGNVKKAKFNAPTGIAVDSKGNVYVSDTGNNVIRKIDTNKNITTFAGGNKNGGYKDGDLKSAEFNSPMGLEIVNDVIYVADAGNQRIRMIKDGKVSTYVGNGTTKDDFGKEIVGDFIDGTKKTAKFNYPVDVKADSLGNLYVADKGNSAIRKVDLGGNVTTVTNGLIKRPAGIAIKDNVLFISDSLLNRIFKVVL